MQHISVIPCKDVEIRKIAYKALCCDHLKVTSQLVSFQSQNLSLVQSLFSGFGKIKKGSWKFLEKLVVQPLLRQLLLPSTGERQLYLLAAALKFPKVENNKRFLFAVYFQNKAHYPTVKYFHTQRLLFLSSTFLVTLNEIWTLSMYSFPTLTGYHGMLQSLSIQSRWLRNSSHVTSIQN